MGRGPSGAARADAPRRSRRAWPLVLGLIVAAATVPAIPGFGHGGPDQRTPGECTPEAYPGFVVTTQDLRQDFLPSINSLSSIDLCLNVLAPVAGPLASIRLNLYRGGNASAPGEQIASATITPAAGFAYVHLDFDSEVVLTPGTRYVLEIPPVQATYQWRATCGTTIAPCAPGSPDGYPGGQTNIAGIGDFGFRTLSTHSADLTALLAPPPVVCPGRVVGPSLGAAVRNLGDAATGPFSAGAHVSSDAEIVPDDTPLAGGRVDLPGIEGESTLPLALPDAAIPEGTPLGRAFLGVYADELDTVVEPDDGAAAPNNGVASPVVITVCAPSEVRDLALSVDEPDARPGSSAAIATIPIGELPFGGTTTEAAPLRNTPLRNTPLRNTPLRNTPLRNTSSGGTALNEIPLSSLPISVAGGWEGILDGTSLTGVPIQSVTVGQVFSLEPEPAGLQSLTLGDIDFGRSPLRGLTLGAISMGGVTLERADGTPRIPLPDGAAWSDLLGAHGLGSVDPRINTLVDVNLLGLPMAEVPFDGIALRSIDLSGSLLAVVPLDAMTLAATPFGAITLGRLIAAGEVVDCAAVDCSASSTQTLAGAQAAGSIVDAATFMTLRQNLDDATLGATTLGGALLGLLQNRADYPWEQIPLGGVEAAGATRLHYHLSFTSAGEAPVVDPVLSATLPAGFRYVRGTSSVRIGGGAAEAIADPTAAFGALHWGISQLVDPGSALELSFEAIPGRTLGIFRSAVAVRSTDVDGEHVSEVAGQAPVRVFDGAEPNDSEEDAVPVSADVLYFSHVNGATDVDLWSIDAPSQPGTQVEILLSHLTRDYDLVLYAPSATPLRNTPLRNTPLRNTPLADDEADVSGTGGQVPPETLQDVPLRNTPLRNTSINRSTGDETIRFTTTSADRGAFILQVSGYNGAFDAAPYVLRVKLGAPAPLPECAPRVTTGSGVPGTIGAVSPGTKTLIIANSKRLGDIYGADAAAAVMADLAVLAARPDVAGAIISPEADPEVAAAYADWDATHVHADATVHKHTCDPVFANNVVTAITSLTDRLREGVDTVRYVVLVGSDEVLPFARIPDGVSLSNEIDNTEAALAATAGNNALVASAAAGMILSDDAYGTTRPTPWFDRQLMVPDLAVGRLVETPAEIRAQIATYVAAGGVADPSTALVAAYDFLSDGGEGVAASLSQQLGPSNVLRLINEGWTRADLVAAFTGATPPPDVAALNGHADQYRLLPAAGNTSGDESDLFTTADVDPAALPAGQILFSMGCHFGLNIPDTIAGTDAARALDWAQRFSNRSVMVANTGFGYGDSAAAALSERLMTLFASRLDGSLTAGEAMMFSKQEYFGTMGVYGVYDEKVLAETVLYGLPMVQVAPVAGAGAAAGGSSASAGGSASLPVDPATGLAYRTLDTGTIAFERTDRPEGSFYSVGGNVLAVNRRPIVPRLDLDVTEAGATAHGVLLTSITSTDVAGLDPVFARAVVDHSSSEPEIAATDVVFPTSPGEITTFQTPGGPAQRLVLLPGVFRGTGTDADGDVIGNMRLDTSLGGQILYSGSEDFRAPRIRHVEATSVGTSVLFEVDTDDAPGDVARVVVLFREPSGAWRAADLVRIAGTGTWAALAPVTTGTDVVDMLVQSVDAAGNVATWRNKGDGLPLATPPGPPGVPIDLEGPAGDGGWFRGPVTVRLPDDPALTFEYSLDGSPFARYTGPVTVSGDGVHSFAVRGSGVGEAQIRIDATGPEITIETPQDGGTYALGAGVAADYACTDALSGAVACEGTVADGAPIDTATTGPKTFAVTARDAAGNGAEASAGYEVTRLLYRFEGFFSPVVNPPAVYTAEAGRTIPLKFRLLLGDELVTRLSAVVGVHSHTIDCAAPTNELLWGSETTPAPSTPPLRVGDDGVYRYNAKTESAFEGTCRRFVVELDDGSLHGVLVRFKAGSTLERQRDRDAAVLPGA